MSNGRALLRARTRLYFATIFLASAPVHTESVESDHFQPSRKDKESPRHHPDIDQVRKALYTVKDEPSEISQFESPVKYQPNRDILEMSLSADGRWNPWEGSVMDLEITEEHEFNIKTHTITGEGGFEPPLSKKWQTILQQIEELGDRGHNVVLPSIKAQRICIKGKLVPSLYLIGTQKAATTNFADKILHTANFVAEPHLDDSESSIHYKELTVFNDEGRLQALGKQGWLDYWPDCEDPVEFAMDATPNYLASANAPGNLVSWYGRLAKQITIVALLREPLARLHSSFYQLQAYSNESKETFTSYVHRAVFNAESGCLSGNVYENVSLLAACENPDYAPIGDPLRLSLYAPELANWLRYFPAKNFVISPWKLYTHSEPGNESLVHYVLNGRMNCTFVGDKTALPDKYHNPRPTFVEAMSSLIPEEKEKLKKLVTNLAGGHILAVTLSPFMKKGLVLFGYGGSADDIPAIAKHIEDHW